MEIDSWRADILHIAVILWDSYKKGSWFENIMFKHGFFEEESGEHYWIPFCLFNENNLNEIGRIYGQVTAIDRDTLNLTCLNAARIKIFCDL